MAYFTKRSFQKDLILYLIKKMGPVSRTFLQKETDFRPATITDITKELLAENIVVNNGSLGIGKGRKQELLSVNSDYLCAIGISIEASDVTFIVGNVDGQILRKIVIDISSYSSSSAVISMIIDTVTQLAAEFSNKQILGVGIGDPGILDSERTTSLYSTQLKFWKNVPIKKILSNKLPFIIELNGNDIIKALGERNFGHAKGVSDFIYVQLGDGIGASIMASNTLICGSNSVAGELGHTNVTPDGALCVCGSYGCLEAEASLKAILTTIQNMINCGATSVLSEIAQDINHITLDDVIIATNLHDKLCTNVVETAGIKIGRALANSVNMLNPQLIILGGVMSRLGDALLQPVKIIVSKHALVQSTQGLRFEISNLKELAAPLGAISMIFNRYFQNRFFDLY